MAIATNGIKGARQAEPVDISIVKNPADLGAVLPTLKYLNSGLPSLATDSDDARSDMLQAAWKLVMSLETPRETMIRHCWAQSGVVAALNTGTVSGLWRTMAQNGDRPQTVKELAVATGMDSVLLARLMRHLASMQYLVQTGTNEYKTTNFTKSMAHELISDSHIAMCSGTSAGAYQFHEFAIETNFQNPIDSHNTSMQRAYKTDLDMFQWLQTIGYGESFNNHMRAYAQGRLRWMDPAVYPVQERLINGASTAPDAPFMVDIGGGVGHDLAAFKEHHPSHPGRLILQDLPQVIEQIKELDGAVVRMSHDFHTPQPVRGARAYFMHSTLHDWPDDVCGSILRNIKAAMAPGYSRLLINENVIPKSNAHWEMTALDMVMLTLFSSRERTEDDWTGLLEANGLRIVKIWQGAKACESLIECELADAELTVEFDMAEVITAAESGSVDIHPMIQTELTEIKQDTEYEMAEADHVVELQSINAQPAIECDLSEVSPITQGAVVDTKHTIECHHLPSPVSIQDQNGTSALE
ncbi:hypothetical protein PFICI_09263 [Pestalotiopsis fici W106-1]|uniref:O-methyltransferase C-terminal domain-containing protein n=1 Tax=Pestalotiopsis fici (strain W106-1 / CGMCC3.15140) TaxID=1229662 RepID=W3WZY6_PESFW|nr:uncharacterized protein PFICI_09263 [Pestalotiopsis fici W106-1]ETS79410.1 hypothetical protein PFICI_09263 [Pestalotiopsis fici W106-1]